MFTRSLLTLQENRGVPLLLGLAADWTLVGSFGGLKVAAYCTLANSFGGSKTRGS